MQVTETEIAGVYVLRPQPHHDDRGFFTRTFDAAIAREHGIELGAQAQDSQSRSHRGVVRGLHGRSGRGEAKLVRCAHGAVLDTVIDIRPDSATFGRRLELRLDDTEFAHLYVPPGMLHGFQALTETADVCYRIDRPHDPSEDLAVRHDDPELAIAWPLPVSVVSPRDAAAPSWRELLVSLGRG
ncbi:dTDP-4-dehydrorhamnose 3,5-epimerase family protein [Amycolatopsis acidiphila]|uniref:dTDP-4-keto-6-deoxy-D-glucose epimerase n=1 Tax=Amycolatopsis acidiphila TaxID=715473 RepID=A0A558AKH9_9PSEU|nr:dTDP-4-dehydrorhamnose 3,5-epimerase family protein [Amycolatopsis acidiphila]TVT24701.1 dTDP-4-keto-6-deoxy-D-glucose epimerase [Amycolatopsis acidiphila]UIJ62667.1 dTDP-4-dehydrorhamnose 3,5-epimerase family protein [Amycolatopsis acidiphila]GHG63494.1 dTDP-4-dehydrorhamnose 3,5-epimerase [Amycolatopsis acidiphila]